jgi:hypothetical protein
LGVAGNFASLKNVQKRNVNYYEFFSLLCNLQEKTQELPRNNFTIIIQFMAPAKQEFASL